MPRKYNHAATLKEVSWEEARPAFKRIKPDLAELIDARKPNQKYPLIQVRYPYGSPIFKNGALHLPNSAGEVVPIGHSTIHASIHDKLSYSHFPLGLMTNNGIEISREASSGRVFTLRFFLPGIIMGLWESLAPPRSSFPTQIWTATAGARFVFTLPKIQAATHFSRLRKDFNLQSQIPKSIAEQWQMFRHIANHPNFHHEWYQEIYYFPKEWVEEDKKNSDWISFHHFLLKEGWELSEYARNIRNQDVVWDLFAKTLSKRSYKPNPYHIDVLKHLITVGMGDVPGIKAAGPSEMAAPARGFQKILIENYKLRQHIPTIMHPHTFRVNDPNEQPVYCSYQVPNLLTSVPLLKTPGSTINEMLLLHELMEIFLEEAFSGHLKLKNTAILDMLKKVKFAYFHSDATGSYKNKILHTREMPKEDPALIYLDKDYGEREFSEYSHFVRGCIRISRK